MPGFAEPKIDWDTDDVLADTDFNRIEGNIYVLARRFELSSVLPIKAASGATLYAVQFKVPADTNLVLQRARFANVDGGALKIDIQLDGEDATKYFVDATEYDTIPAHTLYSNTTGSEQTKTFIVKKDAAASTYFDGCGFYALVEIVDQ